MTSLLTIEHLTKSFAESQAKTVLNLQGLSGQGALVETLFGS